MIANSPRLIGDLTPDEFGEQLRSSGLGLRVGPFDVHLRANVGGIIDQPLHRLYRDYPLVEGDHVFTCHVAMKEVRRFGLRPGRLVRFTVDGRAPHEDLPAAQALAVFEWGLNLVIALRMHCFLMLHSAVVERNGYALALPAAPGSGKTTLCAALAARGWRLLSDEFGLLRPGTTSFVPMPRPMPLKNESIAVVRDFTPGIELGPSIPNTRKGTVAHVRPTAASVQRQHVPACVRWIVFPEWHAESPLSLREISSHEGFMRICTNAFNYGTLGASAFETVREVIGASHCFRLVYSSLDEAVAVLTKMADDLAG